MAQYIVDIPEGTDYWDYRIEPSEVGNNKILVMFEYGSRVTTKHVGYTAKTNSDWREFKVEEIQEDGKRKIKMEI